MKKRMTTTDPIEGAAVVSPDEVAGDPAPSAQLAQVGEMQPQPETAATASGEDGDATEPLKTQAARFHDARYPDSPHVLHEGVGYPGRVTVQFRGGYYTAANDDELAALREMARRGYVSEV